MSERAPEPVTAAANPPLQPLPSNLLPGDVIKASAISDLPAPERQLTEVAKLIDVSKCIGCKACQSACIEWNDTHPDVEQNVGVYENPHDLTPDMFTLMRFTEYENPKTNELEWLIRKDGCMHCADPGCLKACPAPGAFLSGGHRRRRRAAARPVRPGKRGVGARGERSGRPRRRCRREGGVMAEKRVYSAPGDKIETEHPVLVSRYRGFTRLNHWVTALCMIVLLLSGFSFFHPSLFWMTGLFGGGQTTRWLHPIVGLVLVASFLLLFVQMWKLNLPRREDVEWSLRIGDMLRGDEDKLPELGKYNAGQKLVFWGMSVLIAVLVATGIMIWEQYFPDLVTIPMRRIAVAVHALAAVGAILVFILHVYAAIWTRGTIRAMTRGTVTGGWAFRHHRKWLRELAGRQRTDPSK